MASPEVILGKLAIAVEASSTIAKDYIGDKLKLLGETKIVSVYPRSHPCVGESGQTWTLGVQPIIEVPGRIIGVTLSFPNASNRRKDRYRRTAKGSIKLFLCSVYHPYDHAEQIEFYDELESFLGGKPRNSELLLGADVNCNLGIRTPMFRDVIGPHGINNRNNKGKDILYLLKSFNLKILLTFFQHANYVTYRSFSARQSPHMLDNFICCKNFFKRVDNCKTIPFGARSDHSAIKIKFKLTAIKLNLERDTLTEIDWEKLGQMPRLTPSSMKDYI